MKIAGFRGGMALALYGFVRCVGASGREIQRHDIIIYSPQSLVVLLGERVESKFPQKQPGTCACIPPFPPPELPPLPRRLDLDRNVIDVFGRCYVLRLAGKAGPLVFACGSVPWVVPCEVGLGRVPGSQGPGSVSRPVSCSRGLRLWSCCVPWVSASRLGVDHLRVVGVRGICRVGLLRFSFGVGRLLSVVYRLFVVCRLSFFVARLSFVVCCGTQGIERVPGCYKPGPLGCEQGPRGQAQLAPRKSNTFPQWSPRGRKSKIEAPKCLQLPNSCQGLQIRPSGKVQNRAWVARSEQGDS